MYTNAQLKEYISLALDNAGSYGTVEELHYESYVVQYDSETNALEIKLRAVTTVSDSEYYMGDVIIYRTSLGSWTFID